MLRLKPVAKWVWTVFFCIAATSFVGAAYLSKFVEDINNESETSRVAVHRSRLELALASNLRHSLWWLDSKIGPAIAELSNQHLSEIEQYAELPSNRQDNQGQPNIASSLTLPVVDVQIISRVEDRLADSHRTFENATLQPSPIKQNSALSTLTTLRQYSSRDFASIEHLMKESSNLFNQIPSSILDNTAVAISDLNQARVELSQRFSNNSMLANGFSSQIKKSTFIPIWYHSRLLLTRNPDQERIEIVELDWNRLQETLEDNVKPYLPDAQCQPIQETDLSMDNRLASLPIAVISGKRLPEADAMMISENYEPYLGNQLTHLAIWSCWGLSTLMTGILIGGVLQLLHRRSSFVAAVTHELRTPLTSLRLYTDLLNEGLITEQGKQTECLKTLSNEVGRLEHLVENVFSFARLERTHRTISNKPEYLLETLNRMLPRLFQRCEQSSMKLQLINELPKNRLVMMNHYCLEQILFNLVDNCCKYASGQACKEILLVVHTDSNQRLSISVKDFGPGFAKVRHRFSPFNKTVQQAAETSPGIGLGLAICRSHAEQMGAELSIKNWERGGWAQLQLVCSDQTVES